MSRRLPAITRRRDGMAAANESSPLSWQNILGAVAAAAGSAAWVSAVGSGVMGARLDNAGMPVESVLAFMPAEQRFSIGVSHLLAPLFVGLIGFLADWAHTGGTTTPTRSASTEPASEARYLSRLRSEVLSPSRFRNSQRRQLAAGTIAVGALIGFAMLEPPSLWLYLLQIAAIVFALTVVYVFGSAQGRGTSERGAVFLLVLVLAGVIAFAFEQAWGSQFDFAAVSFKEPDAPPLAGYYVTTTSGAVLLITLGDERDPDGCPSNRDLGRITAVPDDQIKRVWIGPREVKFGLGSYCEQKQIALSAITS